MNKLITLSLLSEPAILGMILQDQLTALCVLLIVLMAVRGGKKL